MFISSGIEIANAIRRLTETQEPSEPIRLAVAFWGDGAEELVRSDKRYRIICNLACGGTNPDVIERLRLQDGVEIHCLSNLHAKVAVFHGGAIVSSANFSTNGLGIAGEISGLWVEAGCELPRDASSYDLIVRWFDQLWTTSQRVTDEVISAAMASWAGRRRMPSDDRSNFPDIYRVDSSDEPPTLTETDLFEFNLKPRNKIRMAAKWLVQVFSQIEDINNNSIYVPAYVANIIWTQSGGTVQTNISDMPVFSSPIQVFNRALERSSKHNSRIRALLNLLSEDMNTPPAVKYWAARSLESLPNE